MPGIERFLAAAAFGLVLTLTAGCGDDASRIAEGIGQARLELAKGQHRAALVRLRDLLQRSPENAELRYLLGDAYLETGDFPSAEPHLRRALQLGYDRAKVEYDLTKLLLLAGRYDKALEDTRPDPSGEGARPPEILTMRAMALIGLGKLDEGRKLLDQVLAGRPDLVDALLARAGVAVLDRKLEDAEKSVDRVLALDPGNAEAWMRKGRFLRQKGDAAGSVAAFRKLVDLRPESIAAYQEIILVQIATGEFDEARRNLERVRKLVPNYPLIPYMTAWIEYRKGNYPAARDSVLQVLKVAPNHLPSLLLAGAVFFQLDSQELAQLRLRQALQRSPENLFARQVLAQSLARTGQVTRALETLEPALRQAPQDVGLLGLAGELHLDNNDPKKAAEYFDKAARADPENPQWRVQRGIVRLSQGNEGGALADLEEAARLDSAAYRADLVLITALLRRGNFDRALKAMESLEKKQPANPLTYNLKGAIYIGKKDPASARRQFERALELQPAYVSAAVNLARLDVQDKNPKAARNRFEAMIAKDRKNPAALVALAELAPSIGASLKEQIDWLERARALDPLAVRPQLLLARGYLQSGDTKRAIDMARQVQAANPDNPDALDTLGELLMSGGGKEGATQAAMTYQKLARLQPDAPVVWYRLATAQAASGDREAAGTLKKALALKPDYVEAQVAMAAVEMRAGRHASAMAIARQIQKQSPKSKVGFILEGDVLVAQKQYAQAMRTYETAWSLEPDGALAIKLHGVWTLLGRQDEIEARLGKWVKDSPDAEGVRFYAAHAADASIRLGRYKYGIDLYEQLVQRFPDNAILLNNLAWAYEQAKDPRALSAAERAYKLAPNAPQVTDTLGWILVQRGETRRGMELLQKAISASPKSGDIRLHLAQALMKTGDMARARSELEMIASSGEKTALAERARALLRQMKN